MGCDIHFYVEKKVNGAWQTADKWTPNKYAGEDGEPPLSISHADRFYGDRNYDLFAILANVRNGRGFAGCDTGDGFAPICEPRGLPDDVSQPVNDDSERWGDDGHSHNWLTVAELMAYDWTQSTKHRGWVDALQFWSWNRWKRERGEAPNEYCGSVGGGGVKHLSMVDMEAIAEQASKIRDETSYAAAEAWLKENHPSSYTQVEWSQPYYKSVRSFLSDTLPRLWRLGKPEDVRIVFWFDN